VATWLGYDIGGVYCDRVSGSKGREARSGFDRLHRDAVQRRFGIVMAWSVDRLGRSLREGKGMSPAFRTAEDQAGVTDHSTW
jgi:DNA invertase Pin-like site-specific DNA recombinase